MLECFPNSGPVGWPRMGAEQGWGHSMGTFASSRRRPPRRTPARNSRRPCQGWSLPSIVLHSEDNPREAEGLWESFDMPMKTRECILCDARPTTAAHLFTKVVREEFPNDRSSVFLLHEPRDAASSVKTTVFVGSGQTHTQPRVLCGTCNGAWMGKIEEAAGATIAAMIRNEEVPLPWSVQRSVATWALAAAILRSEIVPGSYRFDPATARAFRQSGIEAVNARVWLINVENSVDIRGFGGSGIASTYLHAGDGEIAIFWMRNLCVFVAAREASEAGDQLISGFRRALIRIWPPTDDAAWPLAHSVTERDLLHQLDVYRELPASFFNQGERLRGKLTETILRVNGNVPADAFHHEILAHRLANVLDDYDSIVD